MTGPNIIPKKNANHIEGFLLSLNIKIDPRKVTKMTAKATNANAVMAIFMGNGIGHVTVSEEVMAVGGQRVEYRSLDGSWRVRLGDSGWSANWTKVKETGRRWRNGWSSWEKGIIGMVFIRPITFSMALRTFAAILAESGD